MRRLELLIDLARELSQNQRFDSNSGVSQTLFTHYFQSAQDSLLKNIVNSKTKFFLKQTGTSNTPTNTAFPIVNGQELYSYPSDIYLQNIDTLEWSQNGLNWIPLDRSITKDRQNIRVGYPFGYWTREDGFLLTPPLQNGYLRVNYIRKPKRLEKRSGKILSVTGAAPITAITLDIADPSQDATYLNKYDSITIVGKNGVQKTATIPITSVVGANITMPAYTLAAGESVAAGDYVLAGPDTVNIPEFPEICETFFIKHANYQAKYGDSSKWSQETKSDMAMCFQEIIDSFKMLTDDVTHVPIINTDYLSLW